MNNDLTGRTAQPAGGSPRSTHFDFQHAVFRVSGARFLFASDGEPSIVMKLGDMEALVPLRSLTVEFALDGTFDGTLLEKVAAGLKHVKIIRPGDSIPREILDGTASWSVEERHHQLARGRMTLQISTWLGGEEQVISDHDSLAQLADDPSVKHKVNQAIGEIAAKLGIPPERKEEVMDRVDMLVRELAYIEALRERFGTIKAIQNKLMEFIRIYKRDRTFEEELLRIELLIRRPIGDLNGIFDQIDAQGGEILSLLRNLDSQIAFIRASRDDLHERMMLWDETIEIWTELIAERSTANELKIRDLYRFLARHFMVAKQWQLTGDSYDRRS